MASVLGPGSLAIAELHAARLDGELFCIDERFSPVDEADTNWLRATALRSLVGKRLVAELDSALWIHGLSPAPPPVHTMCVLRSDRVKFAPSPRFTLREITHAPGDTVMIAGLAVTVPARVLYDLAFIERSDPRAAHRILSRWPSLAAECARRVRAAQNLPGKCLALERLAAWAGYENADSGSSAGADPVDVVDRIDSAHRIEHTIEVRGVAHFEDEAAERKPITRRGDGGGEDVDVMLGEHAGDIREQSGTIESLDLDLHQEDALR